MKMYRLLTIIGDFPAIAMLVNSGGWHFPLYHLRKPSTPTVVACIPGWCCGKPTEFVGFGGHGGAPWRRNLYNRKSVGLKSEPTHVKRMFFFYVCCWDLKFLLVLNMIDFSETWHVHEFLEWWFIKTYLNFLHSFPTKVFFLGCRIGSEIEVPESILPL